VTRRVRVVEVLEFLHVEEPAVLEDLRREGLFLEDEIEPEAAEELRVAACLIRELGVNAAGVDVALQLRRRLACLEDRMRALLQLLADEPRKD
jgi:hypothetical protein